MMHTSLEAAEELAKEGIEAEVIDLRTLLPLDEDTIVESVKKTNRCLVVHEDTKTGGIAGEIAAILCERAFGRSGRAADACDGAGYAGAVLAAARRILFAEQRENCTRGKRTGEVLSKNTNRFC